MGDWFTEHAPVAEAPQAQSAPPQSTAQGEDWFTKNAPVETAATKTVESTPTTSGEDWFTKNAPTTPSEGSAPGIETTQAPPQPQKGHTSIAEGFPANVPVIGKYLNMPFEGLEHVARGIETMEKPGLRTKAGGAHEALSGAFEAATPLMVESAVAAPLKTAATLGAGMVSQEAVHAGLRKMGIPEEYAAVAGDLAGIIAGWGTHKKIEGVSKAQIEKTLKERLAADQAEATRLREENAKLKRTAPIQPKDADNYGAAEKQFREEKESLRVREEAERNARVQRAVQLGRASQPSPGVVRLWRGQSKEYGRPVDATQSNAGTWFTANKAHAATYGKVLKYVDIPENLHEDLLRDYEDDVRHGHVPVFNDVPNHGTVRLSSEYANRAVAPSNEGGKPEAQPRQPQPDTAKTTDNISPESKGPTYMASGLGGFEPFFRESIDEMQAKATKRAAMLDALKKAESTPGQKNVGQRVIQWFTGERDLWGTRVNQTINRVRKMVPATVDQEALSLMRDFKSRPRELQQWLDGTHPNMPTDMDARDAAVKNIAKLRPAIERAMNPTKQMLEADKILTSIAEGSLREGRRIGFLESSISPDEYVTHILHPRGPDELASVPMTERMGRAMGGKIGRRFAYSAKRSYPTLLDAIADNVKPRTLNALDAFTIHGDKFATARASRMLVDHLKDSAMGKWGSRGQANIPADWVEIAPHAHPFQNLRAFVGEGGEPEIARQTLFVPKFIEEALRPITDPDYTSRIIGFARWRGFQAYTKAVQLGMSLFHATTENYMALANMGPKGWAEAIKADRDSDLFREQESDMVQHGGTSPIQGKTFEAYGALQPGSIPTWTDIWRSAPGIKQMDQIAAGITEFTFNNLQRRFKVMNYAMAKAAWMAEHPNASPLERSDAMHSIAKELNAVYGGIQWENAGWNRSTIEMARAIMLAPDWTFSNLFNLKYTMERGTPAGKMARAFWLRSIVGGLVATQMLSLLISRKPSPNPTMVYIGKDKDGKDIFQNVFFKGAPGDLVNLVNNVKDYGAVAGLARLMQGKFAPIPRTALQLTTNRNYLGQEIAPKGEGFWANTMADVNAALQGVSPVPLSFQNLKDMLIGPNSDQYTFPEFATTIFAGTPPKHVKPPGTPEEEAKKAASRKLGTYQPTIEGQRQMRARGNLVQRIKAGDPTVETEIDRQVAEGKLTPRQKANLYRLAAR